MGSAAIASEPIYADASALVKAVVDEQESNALRAYLLGCSDRLVSSKLVLVEVRRAVRLATESADAEAAVTGVLDPVVLVGVTDSILARAALAEPSALRTLDAIHLATALEAGAPQMLVYDRRLAAAAESAGIEVVAPT
jgi:uncharacterized protein